MCRFLIGNCRFLPDEIDFVIDVIIDYKIDFIIDYKIDFIIDIAIDHEIELDRRGPGHIAHARLYTRGPPNDGVR